MLKQAKPNNSQVNTVKQLANTPVQHPKQLLPAQTDLPTPTGAEHLGNNKMVI